MSTLPFKLPNNSLNQFQLQSSDLSVLQAKNKPEKMSHSLSNLSISLPISPHRTKPNSKLLISNFPNFQYPNGISRACQTRIKSMAGDNRDNLDHLQRAAKNQPQQPIKRTPQVAPIGLWDRFPTARTVQQMMETMESMMEDPFAYSGGGGGGGWQSRPLLPESGGYSRGRTPWEIKEGETEYKMRFDMPGMTKVDVKIWVEEKMLVVKAEKVPKKKKIKDGGSDDVEEEDEWSAKSYGRYSCRIALPENVQFDQIKAEVKDGVLYITIPKASTSSKVFDINVE